MRPSSNISSSLQKKRKKHLIRKLILLGVLALCLIATFVFIIRLPSLKIKTVSVVGNTSVSQDEILAIANPIIAKEYLWIIPTDNFFFLHRSDIQKQLIGQIQKLQSVDVSFTDMHDVQISVTERQLASTWCDGVPTFSQNCYGMDTNGLIFEQASSTLSTSTQTYFGLITDANPIGETYFSGHFVDATNFFTALAKMNLNPVSFYATSPDNYEINLAYGGKIIVDNSKTFVQDATDVQAVIDNKYLKTDVASLKKINYIDLRYGNKVVLDFH
jgi:cell division septal protein FtsQ